MRSAMHIRSALVVSSNARSPVDQRVAQAESYAHRQAISSTIEACEAAQPSDNAPAFRLVHAAAARSTQEPRALGQAAAPALVSAPVLACGPRRK